MEEGKASHPAKVLAVVNDLFFEAKIGEVLRTLSIPFAFAKSDEALMRRLADTPAALGIVDMGARGLSALEALRKIRALGVPVIAFFSHIHPDDALRAREAGATAVYSKSELVRELPDLARKYAGGRDQTAPTAARS